MPPSDDLALLLRELGLSDHARTTSPHEVFMGEILPAVRALTSAHERAPKQGEIQRRCWTLTIADGSPSQCQLFNGHEGEHRFYCHRDLKREQREADAALVRRLAEERRLELEATALAAAAEHDYDRQDRFETASETLDTFAGALAAAIQEGR